MNFWDLPNSKRLFYMLGSARLVTIACGIAILLALKRQRYRASQGDLRAARAVLLPIYEPMIVMLIVSLSVEYLFLYLQHWSDSIAFVTLMAQWTLNGFTQTGLVFFFCSHSLSQPSMLRSLFFAFHWSLVGFICALISQLYWGFLGQFLFNACPLVLALLILSKVIYRRRSVVPYLQFIIVHRIVWCCYALFTIHGPLENLVGYLITMGAIGIMELPLCVWWYLTFFNDTYFWRTGGLKISGAARGVFRSVRKIWRRLGDKTSSTTGRGGGASSPRIHRVLVEGGASPLLSSSSSAAGEHTGPDLQSENELNERSTLSWWRGGGFRSSRSAAAAAAADSDDDEETPPPGQQARLGGYEVEAMQRIQMLQRQERAFERAQQAKRARLGCRAASPRSHADAFYGGPPAGGTGLSSSPSGHTLPREEQLLAGGSDSLLSHDVQLLIEQNKRRFIDFALLHINDEDCIGRGGSSRVYSGFYRNYPVAIKFFAAGEGNGGEELTPQTIRAYAKETAIAAAFNHPSVVKFIGICVRPPTIFLVSELCSEGSLFDVLPRVRFHPAWGYQSILGFAVQCARSVEYIHSGGFVHRDIKSLNYMVTRRGEVKLTDFGLSRMFPQWADAGAARASAGASVAGSAAGSTAAPHAAASGGAATAAPSAPYTSSSATRAHPSSHAFHGHVPPPQRPSVRRTGVVPADIRCWMSPEMLHGHSYSLSSDIYSLTMVLWEVLTCEAPFDDVADEDVTEVLLSGATPAVPAWTPAPFRQLLAEGWARDPAARPSAANVLARLTAMLAELEQEYNLEPLDPSIFFGPEAAEEAYAHQAALFQQQQQQLLEQQQQQQQYEQSQQVVPGSSSSQQRSHSSPVYPLNYMYPRDSTPVDSRGVGRPFADHA